VLDKVFELYEVLAGVELYEVLAASGFATATLTVWGGIYICRGGGGKRARLPSEESETARARETHRCLY
jgi:hypothetical protein